MIEFLNSLDTSIFLAINGYHTTFLDNLMMLFSSRFTWLLMYAAVIWIIFKSSPTAKTACLYLGTLILAVLLADQICASLIRPAVERLRPSNPDNIISDLVYIVNGYRGGAYGFPSCHASNSFALAVFVTLFAKRYDIGICIMTWALLNSYSRLYLGVHYPGDLLTGAIIGSLLSVICYYAARAFEQRYLQTKIEPRHTNLLIIIFLATLLIITSIALFEQFSA
jgi:undecaprenyl-diphosphatase